MRIDIKPGIPRKSDQRDAQLLRQITGVVGRRGFRNEYGAAHGRNLVHDLCRDSAAEYQNAIFHGNLPQQTVSNHLIHSHMAADIFFI